MRLLGLLLAGALEAHFAFGVESATPGLAEIVDRFEKLQISDAASLGAKVHLVSGHLDCTLSSGTIAPVKAGEEVVGLFPEYRGR